MQRLRALKRSLLTLKQAASDVPLFYHFHTLCTQAARSQLQAARTEAESARASAEAARTEAESARAEAAASKEQGVTLGAALQEVQGRCVHVCFGADLRSGLLV